MTEFRILAERIAEDIYNPYYCCIHLSQSQSRFFTRYFKPTPKERSKYNHSDSIWMLEFGALRIENNNLRILALLFVEQLWLDEVKEGRDE